MIPRVLNGHIDAQNDSVYVGRPSKWGNPFEIGKDGNRATVIRKYEKYMLASPALMNSLHELRGKDLMCWCAPKACHADILLDYANRNVVF